MNAFVELYKLDDWFTDILGAIRILSSDPDYRRGGGWAAYMDAAILQAINDGYRLYLGQDAIGSGSTHGGSAWRDFFAALLAGMEGNQLIVLRLAGEQGGVDYARGLAETQRRYAAEDERVQIKIDLFLWGADSYRSFGQRCRGSYSCNFRHTDPRQATETRLLRTAAQLPEPVSWMLYSLVVEYQTPSPRVIR
jgi:hypothetical protein